MAKFTAWMVIGCAAVLAGCSSDTATGTSGSGGTGQGGDGGTTTSGSGGTGAGTGAAGGGTPMCYGDQATWDSIVKTDIPCTDASDCCIVANSCTAESYMVGAPDFSQAQDAWPYCEPDQCANCLPPHVDIACDNDVCTGRIDTERFMEGTSHCGMAGATLPAGGETGTSYFTCDGAQ